MTYYDHSSEELVTVEWTIETTETFRKTMPFTEFATLFDDPAPSIEDVQAGEADKSDIDAERLADAETDEASLYRSVDERYVDSFTIHASPAEQETKS